MRHIDHIILHCSATPAGRATTVAEIENWHRARGWRDPASGKSIGYHYVVHLDGRVSPGRPVSSVGAHVAGHNTGSIGVCYIGGVDKLGKPKDTRTAAQKVALDTLLRDLVKRFPIRDISGHNEWAAKACPSFDASAEYDRLITSDVPRAQRKEGVLADGIISDGEADGPDETAVAEWQRQLIAYGYDIKVTGKHTGLSVQATRWFQQARGILVDGAVGPQTSQEMDAVLAGRDTKPAPSPDDGPSSPPPKPAPKPGVPEGATGAGGGLVAVEGIASGNWWVVGLGVAIVAVGVAIYLVRRKRG